MIGDVADLILVTGPPSAGKTTVARLLVRMFEPSALVNGDDFFAFIDQGYIPPWTGEANRQNEIVTDAAAAAAGRLAAGGYTVVYDGVIGPWFLETFGATTGLTHLHYVMLLPPERTCVDRVSYRTGHGFTDLDAARHMYQGVRWRGHRRSPRPDQHRGRRDHRIIGLRPRAGRVAHLDDR